MTQVELAAVPMVPETGVGRVETLPQVRMGDLAEGAANGQSVANPAALANEFYNGVRDLLKRSEAINKTVSEDFLRAQSRVKEREAEMATGAAGRSALMGREGTLASLTGAFGLDASQGSIMPGPSLLPGPAARHPGAGHGGRVGADARDGWQMAQDINDQAYVRHIVFMSFQMQSAELQKITQQLTSAINTLMRAS